MDENKSLMRARAVERRVRLVEHRPLPVLEIAIDVTVAEAIEHSGKLVGSSCFESVTDANSCPGCGWHALRSSRGLAVIWSRLSVSGPLLDDFCPRLKHCVNCLSPGKVSRLVCIMAYYTACRLI